MAMKTFTSLFALLSCLSVYNAQADVTLWVYSPYPSYHYLHWWGSPYSATWGDSNNTFEKLSQGNTTIIDGDTFYKIELKSNNADGSVYVIFYNKDENQQTPSDGIKLTAGEHFYYYFGGTEAYTNCPISLKISGKFDGDSWSDKSFVKNSMTNWTYTLTPTVSHDFDFGLKPTDTGWLAKGLITDDPQGLISTYDDNSNLVLNHVTGRSYKLTATWSPRASFNDIGGWSLKIEGINTYSVGDNTYDISANNVLTLADGSTFYATASFSATTATYTRPSTGYHWGTLCLPFEIQNTYDGVTFYQLSSVTETSMKFTPIEGTIAAGTPVAFKLDDPGTLTINESNVEVVADPTTAGISNWTMKGTFQRKTLDGIYYVYNDKYYCGDNITVKPYRGWFETSAPTNGALFRIEIEEEQSLQFVEQEDGTVMATFDLQGRKLDNARKGLVIENGKIIMIK